MNYEILESLKDTNSICLISHIMPDADALASMVVLKDFLHDKLNVNIVDLFAETHDNLDFYKDILGTIEINKTPKLYDVAIMLDSPNAERIGIYKSLYTGANKKVIIDHHATNDFSGDINIVEQCSSTCEIIYSILMSYNYSLSNASKGKLYSGIITDTNNFTVGNYTARTFQIASEIIDDINNDEIYNYFLSNNSLQQMKLLSMAINNLHISNCGKIIVSHIDNDDISLLKASHNDCSGIVNKLATISGSKLVCFIYPTNNNEYYVSLRAKNGYNVSSIAKKYFGGGHDGAAAFLSNKTINEIKELVLSEFEAQTAIEDHNHFKLF